MQFEIYQWLVPLIGIFYISRTIYQYTQHRRSAFGTAIWIFFWLAIMLLAIIPNAVSNKLALLLGFKSNVTAIIFVALGLLFLFVFYLSSTVERLEGQITELVRKIALEEIEKEMNKTPSLQNKRKGKTPKKQRSA